MIVSQYKCPANVGTYDGVPLANYLDGNFWLSVIESIEVKLGCEFSKYQFLFYSLPSYRVPVDFDGVDRNTILIVLSDNSGNYYHDNFKCFRAVFKVHMKQEQGNVFPVPLGYTNYHLRDNQSGINERRSNVFYSGNINAFRVDLWRSLRFSRVIPRRNIRYRSINRAIVYAIRRLNLRQDFDSIFADSYIRFTKGFATGMCPEEYTRWLESSKIALSPHGFWRAECFRHFEAMRSGNVVISDPLPSTWYFKDCPIVQVSNWSDLRGIVNNLLSDPLHLADLQSKTLAWWNDYCSPQAVALYMAEKIKNNLGKI